MTEVFAKLSKLCFPPSGSYISTKLVITAKATVISDLKLAAASISLPAETSSSAPSLVPLRISIPAELTASGNYVLNSTISFISQDASIPSQAFFGAGTINGRKQIVIKETYGTREIYSNGSGGFYTLAGDTNIKEARSLINMTAGVTALGDGDTQKTRTASISIPAEIIADLDTLIGTASISIQATCAENGELTLFGTLVAPISIDALAFATGFATENLRITTQDILDWDSIKIYTRHLAKIEFDDDGYVYKTIGDTGIRTQSFPLTDWIDQKANSGSKDYRVRATLHSGTAPTSGTMLNIWSPINGVFTPPFWENTFLSPFELFRTTSLNIELSDDGGITTKAIGRIKLEVNRL